MKYRNTTFLSIAQIKWVGPKLILKLHGNSKRPSISKTIFKKKKFKNSHSLIMKITIEQSNDG